MKVEINRQMEYGENLSSTNGQSATKMEVNIYVNLTKILIRLTKYLLIFWLNDYPEKE